MPLTPTNSRSWTNRHETFTQSISELFDLSNANTGNVLDDYNTTTSTIKQLLADAAQQGKTVRALGGGWSFTPVAATDGWIVNTKPLNIAFNIRAASIHPSYTGDREQLLFAQCGLSIQQLNTLLEQSNRSLKTCGASNGQTIVGAFSTGTHGSAIDIGATQDFIVGMHIVVSADRDIWLERVTNPVASLALLDKLNTELVQDDEQFEAALVSMGSMGFIHGVMLQTEPKYLLEAHRVRLPFDQPMQQIMRTLDFTVPNSLPHGNERPFHFQVVIDPFNVNAGTITTVMYKRPFTNDYIRPQVDDPNAAGPGDDVPAFLGKITDHVPVITPLIVSTLVRRSYKLYDGIKGTCGEIFTNNNIRGKVLSTAMGIPADRTIEVNDLLMQVNRTDGPFTGIFSYRYSKKSRAMMSFTRFEQTLILELDGVESSITRQFYTAVWRALNNSGIPYTFHWGKINNLDTQIVRHMYGTDRERWIIARNALLPPASQSIFSSPVLRSWGLE